MDFIADIPFPNSEVKKLLSLYESYMNLYNYCMQLRKIYPAYTYCSPFYCLFETQSPYMPMLQELLMLGMQTVVSLFWLNDYSIVNWKIIV